MSEISARTKILMTFLVFLSLVVKEPLTKEEMSKTPFANLLNHLLMKNNGQDNKIIPSAVEQQLEASL